VNKVIETLNTGAELAAVLESTPECRTNELAQITKLWFSQLPGRLVSSEHVPAMKREFETDKNYVAFVKELPLAHQYALKFLCGVLQKVVRAEQTTKMNGAAVGVVFGPALVAPPPPNRAAEIAAQITMVTDFLAVLIERWDTSDIYPMPSRFLSGDCSFAH
jgi:hypothetical protein